MVRPLKVLLIIQRINYPDWLCISDESKKSDICAVLQFILRLKDTGGTASQGALDHTEN